MIPKAKMIENYEKRIKRLDNRINFLEGEEYGKPIYEMGLKKGISETIKNVIEILSKHPRSDNYSIDGRLVSADFVIIEKIKKLDINEK